MKIVETAEMRAAEAAAVADGIPEFTLMKRAGSAAAELISSWMRRWHFSRIVFLCGGGNNAGDALVAAARLAAKHDVVLLLSRPLADLRGAAALAASELPEQLKDSARSGIDELDIHPGDLLIDGLLGIGLTGEVRPALAEMIRKVNLSRLPVISLDVPSGMDSDTGEGRCPDGEAVHAACTICFGLPKRGLFTPDGINFSGELRCAGIGLEKYAASNNGWAYTDADAAFELPRFFNDIHKRKRGELLVMAGSRRYPGAGALAVRGALRGGAGVVRSFIPAGTQFALPLAAIPSEASATASGGFAETPDWKSFPHASALVAGSGWGDDVPAAVLSGVLDFPGDLVLDADALNLLSRHPKLWRRRSRVVLTPHPGEALRLQQAFGLSERTSRTDTAIALAERFGAVVLLKGARTVVACENGRYTINTSGSPALATAGSGDVLAGLIGALLANGADAFRAARLGAFIHGRAGEACGRGSIADDFPTAIGMIIAQLEKQVFFS